MTGEIPALGKAVVIIRAMLPSLFQPLQSLPSSRNLNRISKRIRIPPFFEGSHPADGVGAGLASDWLRKGAAPEDATREIAHHPARRVRSGRHGENLIALGLITHPTPWHGRRYGHEGQLVGDGPGK
jgi:hypothetical protein